MRRKALAGIALCVALMASSLALSSCARARKDDIPAEFAGLYTALDKSLDRLSPAGAPGQYKGLVCTNLLSANSNSLPAVADSWTNRFTTRKTLDRFVEIGISCVDITLQYPTLVKDFPRSADYLAYYREVVAEARKRDLKVIIGVQSTFTNPVFARLPVAEWYKGLTKERYMAEKRQMLETVLKELAPDYLTVEAEPGTQQANLGLDYSLESTKQYTDAWLMGLDQGKVKIGAGAGMWDDLAYWEYYAANDRIDYLDLHIYPVNDPGLAAALEKVSNLARKNGKSVIIGESWLYKMAGNERQDGPIATAVRVFGRDPYSFWAPLDMKFIDTMLALGARYDWEMVSLFWSRYFFSYSDYRRAPQDVNQRLAQVQKDATKNIYFGRLSPTGEHLKNLLKKP
jgi:hypothetical protein